MKPVDIGKAYDLITDMWTSDKFDNDNGIPQHRRAVEFTKGRQTALDVGCGCNGRLFDLLIEYGFTPEGVDISEKMIKIAQRKYPDIKLYHQDICVWEPPKRYDFITAWDSIWHVPFEENERVLKKLFSKLNKGGVCIFSCGGTDTPGFKTDDYMGPTVYYSTLGIPKFLNVIDRSGCIVRHLEYDQYPELHAYIIVQKI